jgi:acetylornithine deacetylase
LKTEKNRAFDPPFTTLNVGVIQGGTAKNIVAGECRMLVEWRPVPGFPADRAAHLIRDQLKKLKQIDATFEIKRLDPPFEPSTSRELVSRVEKLAGRRASTVSFGTEAAHLAKLSGEVIVFGPGDMTTAHRTGECVPVRELRECVNYLTTLIREYCA